MLAILVVVGVAAATGGCSGSAAQPPPAVQWSAAASPEPSPSPSAAPASPSPAAATYAFPVQGKASYARTHHDYPASDIIAACGLNYLAVTSGRVVQVNRVDTWTKKVDSGISRGGLSISIVGDDGVRYYGSHFSTINPEIQPGVRVTTGQVLAKVGRTGDAGACHVHFGISPPCAEAEDWWVRRGVLWPWSYLDAWRAGTVKTPLAEVTAWQADHGCPSTEPAGA
jgi:peptidoglycan LD-endopeptidase LytH